MTASRSIPGSLVTFLCCLVGLAAAPLAAEDLRLGDAVAPTFERLVLELDPAADAYRGSAHVDLVVRQATPVVRFHAEEMELGRIELRRAGANEPIAVERRALPGARIELAAATPLAPGAYTLDVDFENDFGHRAVGLYRTELAGAAYLFTQFEAVDAREAFPCWDEPGFKQPWQLVLTVPSGLVPVTNAPVVARAVAGERETVTFARTAPLPAYLVAIAVGPFDVAEIPGLGVPGRVVAPRGMGPLTGTAVAAAPPLLAELERYFGRPYPFAKLDLIAVPEFWPGAMENAGAITFADRILLLDPARATAGQEARLTEVATHEMAHMWFGDLVTMAWWDDLWLNESFADWMAKKVVDRVHPEVGFGLSELHGVQRILEADGRAASRAIRQPVEDPAQSLQSVGLAYAKGRAILDMVEGWLGEETFRRGVADYVAHHAGGNAVGADLWGALSRAAGRQDVAAVLTSFLDQPGYPLLEVIPGADGEVGIRQRRYLAAGVTAPDQRWTLPVVLRWGRGGETGTASVVLADEAATLDLGAPVDWLLPGAGGVGYYRWTLPPADFERLVGRATEVLTPAERIALLGNATALLEAGVLPGDRYLRTVEAFAADPEPEVTAAVLSALGKIRVSFADEGLRRPFAAYVRQLLAPAAARYGWEARPGEPEAVSRLRPDLFAWLGDAGADPAVRARADALARAFLADPASVDGNLAGDALRIAALDADAATFDRYRQRFEAARDPGDRRRWLTALGAFRRPQLRDRALAYLLEGPLRATELFDVIRVASETPAGHAAVWRWLTAHYGDLAERLPAEFMGFAPNLASGCSAELLDEARTFFADPAHQTPATADTLARTASEVEECVALRRREGATVAAYLRSRSTG